MTDTKDVNDLRHARTFGFVLAGVMTTFGSLSYYFGHPTRATIFGSLAVTALLGAVLFLPLWAVVHRAWMAVARKIAEIVTAVLLGIFFYGVLTPFGVLKRLLGHPPLDTAWRDGRPTYWKDKRAGTFTLARYEKQH